MKSLNKYLVLIMALLMCLAITACGNDDSSDDDYRAPAVIEDAAYDSAAAYDSSYNISAYGPLPTATCAMRSRSRQLTAACTSPCTMATT
mgnify:CR=1 FL=1